VGTWDGTGRVDSTEGTALRHQHGGAVRKQFLTNLLKNSATSIEIFTTALNELLGNSLKLTSAFAAPEESATQAAREHEFISVSYIRCQVSSC